MGQRAQCAHLHSSPYRHARVSHNVQSVQVILVLEMGEIEEHAVANTSPYMVIEALLLAMAKMAEPEDACSKVRDASVTSGNQLR